MQLTALLTDDEGVSPVIGVILMVAITVILAAVVGSFALGLDESTPSPAPQASFSFEWDDSADEVTVTHTGGDTITGDNLVLRGDSSDDTIFDGDTVQAGSSDTSGSYSNDETVQLVWQSPDDQSTQILATYETPS